MWFILCLVLYTKFHSMFVILCCGRREIAPLATCFNILAHHCSEIHQSCFRSGRRHFCAILPVLIVTEPLDRPCALQGCLRHSMGRLVWALTLTLLTLLWPGAKVDKADCQLLTCIKSSWCLFDGNYQSLSAVRSSCRAIAKNATSILPLFTFVLGC